MLNVVPNEAGPDAVAAAPEPKIDSETTRDVVALLEPNKPVSKALASIRPALFEWRDDISGLLDTLPEGSWQAGALNEQYGRIESVLASLDTLDG